MKIAPILQSNLLLSGFYTRVFVMVYFAVVLQELRGIGDQRRESARGQPTPANNYSS